MILLVYVCLAAPFIVCFGIHVERLTFLGMVELLVDLVFTIDVRSASWCFLMQVPSCLLIDCASAVISMMT
jgi:hypothetical protein